MDLNDIFKTSELLQFWPNASQGPRQRVSATARFIIYAVCLFYIISRDVRIFALGAVALGVLYYVWKTQLSSPESGISYYTAPTTDNSMANPVPGDAMNLPGAAWYPSVRDKVQDAWSNIHPFENIRNAERNFYSVPVFSCMVGERTIATSPPPPTTTPPRGAPGFHLSTRKI